MDAMDIDTDVTDICVLAAAGANRGAKPCSPQVGRLFFRVVVSRADVFNANRSAQSASRVNLLHVKLYAQ